MTASDQLDGGDHQHRPQALGNTWASAIEAGTRMIGRHSTSHFFSAKVVARVNRLTAAVGKTIDTPHQMATLSGPLGNTHAQRHPGESLDGGHGEMDVRPCA